VKKHIIFIQSMIDNWNFYGTASSFSPLLTVWSTHFLGLSRLCTSTLFLLQAYNFFTCFLLKVIFLTGNIISRTIPNLVKFKDISRTWKMNLLFSKLSRICGNPGTVIRKEFTGSHIRTHIFHGERAIFTPAFLPPTIFFVNSLIMVKPIFPLYYS